MSRWLALIFSLWAASLYAQPVPITGSTLQNAATATGNGLTQVAAGYTTASYQVAGTFSATVNPEGTVDGTNWSALTCYALDGVTTATTITAAGTWRCNISGMNAIRARISSYASGSVTVNVTVLAGGSAKNITIPAVAANTYYCSSYPTGNAALTAVNALPSATLVLDTTCAISTSATVNASVTVFSEGNGTFSVASGKTLTVKGPILAPATSLFTGSGTVSVSANVTRSEWPIEWFGGKADTNVTDNALAISACKTALTSGTTAAGTCVMQTGVYGVLTAFPTIDKTGFRLRGAGIISANFHVFGGPWVTSDLTGTVLYFPNDVQMPTIVQGGGGNHFTGFGVLGPGTGTRACFTTTGASAGSTVLHNLVAANCYRGFSLAATNNTDEIQQSTFSDLHAMGTGAGNAFELGTSGGGQVTNAVFRDLEANQCTIGFHLVSGNSIVFEGYNYTQDCTAESFKAESGVSAETIKGVYIGSTAYATPFRIASGNGTYLSNRVGSGNLNLNGAANPTLIGTRLISGGITLTGGTYGYLGIDISAATPTTGLGSDNCEISAVASTGLNLNCIVTLLSTVILTNNAQLQWLDSGGTARKILTLDNGNNIKIGPIGGSGVGNTYIETPVVIQAASVIRSGSGTPEGAVTGSIGDVFMRTDGTYSASAYVKENNNASSSGWGGVLTSGLRASASLNFASAAATTCSTDLTITVTGALVASAGAVLVGAPNGSVNAGSVFTGWVSADNTVTVRHCNVSAGANDPAAGTFTVTVLQ